MMLPNGDRVAMNTSRRSLLKMAAALLVDQWTGLRARALSLDSNRSLLEDGPKVIVLTCGGIRWNETFQESGLANIPNLYRELLPQSTFYPAIRNEGATSHFNTTSSIVTGNWQRVDDWGKTPPQSPTIFEYMRKSLKLPQKSIWFISSNKALTKQMGASSVSGYGIPYGANVLFPKQLIIDAVARAAAQGHAAHSSDRALMRPELEAMLSADNYEGLGWSVSGESSTLDDSTRASVLQAIEDLARTSAPVTGDEFTFLVSVEIMRRFAPPLLAMSFSDVEVAHFGSYSLHVAGIRTLDRLVHELWSEVQANPSYRGRTTLFVMPEFGRDLDGSNTNGFFNHRLDNDSTRLTWMMSLGAGARPGVVVERPVQHIDICPTIGNLFGLKLLDMAGKALPEIRL
jgi:hypothetical protein